MQNTIFRLIEEAMEADEGSIQTGQPLEWDSISVVTFMALVDERLDKIVPAKELNKCVTVDEVASLVTAI